MTLFKATLAVIAAVSFAGYAQAHDNGQDGAQDSGAYVGIGASAYVTEPIGAFGADLFTLDAKAGYNFNAYFGVEAQGSIGLNTDSDPFAGGSFNTKIDYSLSGFAVARWPVSEKFDLLARAGIHNTQVGRDLENPPLIDGAPFTVDSITETGLAVGVGAQYSFDKKNAIRADYTFLDGAEAETLSIGYIRNF